MHFVNTTGGLNVLVLLVFIAGVIFGTLVGLLVAGHKWNNSLTKKDTKGNDVPRNDPFWLKYYNTQPASSTEGESDDEIHGEFKVVLCVRTDLQMGKGKMCAQSGHATLALYRECIRRQHPHLQKWLKQGQRKIAVKINEEAELLAVQRSAILKHIPTA